MSSIPKTIRRYTNAKELTQKSQNRFVIDLFGLTETEARSQYPQLFQQVLERVKPLRDQNKRKTYKHNFWVFGEQRPALRVATEKLARFIVVPETSKYKPFVFIGADYRPDHKLYVVASDDAWVLGVLSSKVHNIWAITAGGHLGVGNDPTWTSGTCFRPFPFPDPDEALRQKIREVGEQLDAHRKRQQSQHPNLTMTGMYNVLEKLRAGEPLSKKEQTIHEQGLVSVLKEIHDRLDEAVADAYAWPRDLGEEEILERLVELNAQQPPRKPRARSVICGPSSKTRKEPRPSRCKKTWASPPPRRKSSCPPASSKPKNTPGRSRSRNASRR